jgi:hypothetical protein
VLKVERTGNKYKLYVNGTQVASERQMALTTDPVYVGLIAAFGGGESPITLTAKFDQLECTGAGCGTSSLKVAQLGNPSPARWSASVVDGRVAVVAPNIAAARTVASVELFGASGRRLAASIPSKADVQSATLRLGTNLESGAYLAVVRLSDGSTKTLRVSAIH